MVGITALPASTTTSTAGGAVSVARSFCASQPPVRFAAASVVADSGGKCSAILISLITSQPRRENSLAIINAACRGAKRR